jgi:hypothetical protein
MVSIRRGGGVDTRSRWKVSVALLIKKRVDCMGDLSGRNGPYIHVELCRCMTDVMKGGDGDAHV